MFRHCRILGNMEPKLITDPKLKSILEELKKRESIFHRPEFGTHRSDFEGKEKRKTRRCTIWRRSGKSWKILYHQGTVVQDND